MGSFSYYVGKIFRKTNISDSRDTHTFVCVSGGKKC